MRRFFMLLTAMAFTCGVASAKTAPVTCDTAKLDSLKQEREADLNTNKTIKDPVEKKKMWKKIKSETKLIKELIKACKKTTPTKPAVVKVK